MRGSTRTLELCPFDHVVSPHELLEPDPPFLLMAERSGEECAHVLGSVHRLDPLPTRHRGLVPRRGRRERHPPDDLVEVPELSHGEAVGGWPGDGVAWGVDERQPGHR